MNGAQAYDEGLGTVPQPGQGLERLVSGRFRGRSPLKFKAYSTLKVHKSGKICTLTVYKLFSPKVCYK